MTKVSVVVYGADVVCASCVNAPTSKNTYEWLKPLLERKYPNIHFEYTYIDFQKETENLSDVIDNILSKLKMMSCFTRLLQ